MIEIDGLTKHYDGVAVVDDVTLTLASGRTLAVVGTSGSGKTTLLRMINRLVEPSAGTIRVDGQDTRDSPPHELRRRIGYVIQGNGLFPHRTVGENIATVPRLVGWPAKRIAARVEELLDLFQLDPATYRDRMPHELSGGQQQRVGVARALAAEPAILLMDEPFGALDPLVRARARDDLAAIRDRFGTTVVLVTHDMDEAIRLGHLIAVMHEGKLVRLGTPEELIVAPGGDFVAALLGADRPFRLLSLLRSGDLVTPGAADGPPIDAETSARDALADLLWTGRDAAPVARDGAVIGAVTRATLAARAAPPG